MLKSILTSAFRHLVRYRTYTLINIIGLTVGLACCLVILLVIRHELRYDQHHEHADRIFRVISATKSQGDDFVWNPGNTGLVGPQMKETFPQVEAYTRIQPHRVQVRLGENILTNQLHVLTDPSVLDVFTFPLILGNKSNAFDKPWSILISARLAQKTFGEENPLGKTITVDDRLLGSDYTSPGFLKTAQHLQVIPSNQTYSLHLVKNAPFSAVLGVNTSYSMYRGDQCNTMFSFVKMHPPATFVQACLLSLSALPGGKKMRNTTCNRSQESISTPGQITTSRHQVT